MQFKCVVFTCFSENKRRFLIFNFVIALRLVQLMFLTSHSENPMNCALGSLRNVEFNNKFLHKVFPNVEKGCEQVLLYSHCNRIYSIILLFDMLVVHSFKTIFYWGQIFAQDVSYFTGHVLTPSSLTMPLEKMVNLLSMLLNYFREEALS